MKAAAIRVFDGLRVTTEHMNHLQDALRASVEDLRSIAGLGTVQEGFGVELSGRSLKAPPPSQGASATVASGGDPESPRALPAGSDVPGSTTPSLSPAGETLTAAGPPPTSASPAAVTLAVPAGPTPVGGGPASAPTDA